MSILSTLKRKSHSPAPETVDDGQVSYKPWSSIFPEYGKDDTWVRTFSSFDEGCGELTERLNEATWFKLSFTSTFTSEANAISQLADTLRWQGWGVKGELFVNNEGVSFSVDGGGSFGWFSYQGRSGCLFYIKPPPSEC